MGQGLRACIDSDVLIDFLQGRPEARLEIARYDDLCASYVTWIEVMTGAIRAGGENHAREVLSLFDLHRVDAAISESAASLRVHHRLRTPDAVIWATAQAQNALLVTRNSRDFPSNDIGIRFPYRI
jgi:predicted nucleic acid-binding protein